MSYGPSKSRSDGLEVEASYRFAFHMESVANFSRASLVSNDTTHDLRATALLTTSKRSFNVDEIFGEKEPSSILDSAPIEGQRSAVFQKSAEFSLSKVCRGKSTTPIEEVTTGDDEVVAGFLHYGTEAASERSKSVYREERHSRRIYDQEDAVSEGEVTQGVLHLLSINVIGRTTRTGRNTKHSVDTTTKWNQMWYRIENRSGPSIVG